MHESVCLPEVWVFAYFICISAQIQVSVVCTCLLTFAHTVCVNTGLIDWRNKVWKKRRTCKCTVIYHICIKYSYTDYNISHQIISFWVISMFSKGSEDFAQLLCSLQHIFQSNHSILQMYFPKAGLMTSYIQWECVLVIFSKEVLCGSVLNKISVSEEVARYIILSYYRLWYWICQAVFISISIIMYSLFCEGLNKTQKKLMVFQSYTEFAPSDCHMSTWLIVTHFTKMYNSCIWLKISNEGCTVVWWLALSPHSERVPGSGYSGFLPPSKNMHVRLIGVSKIVLRSVCGCLSRLSLCDPVMDWWPVQGVPRLSPDDRWDRLQPPRTRSAD